jgi:hypothetical protein
MSNTLPDRTADGVPIVSGLCVWDYNLNATRVTGPEPYGNPAEPTWYRTENGGSFDGSRMRTRHPVTNIPAREVVRPVFHCAYRKCKGHYVEDMMPECES